jgi:hypothetical protein
MKRPGALPQYVAVLCLVAGVAPGAFASGTGIPLFGNPIAGTSRTISRQIVRMASTADGLVGRPGFGSIAMIAAYAPGCVVDDIVIQEKAEGDSALLQIVAPSCLRARLVRATLFLRNGTCRVRVARSGGAGWVECRLQSISMPRYSHSDQASLSAPAVVIDDLGPIQLLGARAEENASAGSQLLWTADPRTRIGRAAWHLLWPSVTLAIFSLLSWTVHKVATPRNKG